MSDINKNLTTAYQIGKYIHSLIDKDQTLCFFGEKHFNEGPNPGFNQTESGLFLEEYYETPSKIYTNIGCWNILGSTSCKDNGQGWKNIINILKHSLNLELHKEIVINDLGCFGPVWKIKSFNGFQLDEPILKEYTKYINYRESKDIFKNFNK